MLLAPANLDLRRFLSVHRHKRAIGFPADAGLPLCLRPTTTSMLLRTWAARSKPCFSVAHSSLACRQNPHLAFALRLDRNHLLAGYATSKIPPTSENPSSTPVTSSSTSGSTLNGTDTSKIPNQASEASQSTSEAVTEKTPPPILRENIYTIPNLLTVSRIISCPFLGYFIVNGNFVAATSLLFYAGVSDLVRLSFLPFCLVPEPCTCMLMHAPDRLYRWMDG